jgi:hypothetical protein
VRRSRLCRVDSCVEVQDCRRASSGCVELGVFVEGAVREERKVSCSPGAEGAPRSRESLEDALVEASFEVVVFDVEVG